MHEDIGSLTGWARHEHFGLRWEWLDAYFRDQENWHRTANMGNRQIESLEEWLETTGLADRDGLPTQLGRVFAEQWPDPSFGWQLLWTNVVFNLATAYWYVLCLGIGEWTTRQMRSSLEKQIPRLSVRTVSNAINGLVGLLERTPVGSELGQGIVKPTRPRRVKRVGMAGPHPCALAHAARRLFLFERRDWLYLDEDLVWPWTVFGCDKQEAITLLTSGGQPWLQVDDRLMQCHLPLEDLRNVPLF